MEDKLAKHAKVKSKAPAPIQITAEQLLREASERLDPNDLSRKTLLTSETTADYRQRNRQFFEDKLRRDRMQMGIWIRYASFEESQKEWSRARSVYERALDCDPYNITIFLKYAEMEMKNKHVNLARNIWDRAITIQPRVDQFWYKYVYMEETLGNLNEAREIFERWIKWEPEEQIWFSYIKFEKRYKQWNRIRNIFERFISIHPTVNIWLSFAKFEEEGGNFLSARNVFERASDSIDSKHREPRFYIEFAKFEVRMKEYERARFIYKFALELFPKSEAEGLWNSYSQFERQYGDEKSITQVILNKRRALYEEKLNDASHNYDIWFDYIRMEEENGDIDIVRELYERAIANVPPAPEKRLWRRYIYLWIYYAVFEELTAKDFDRTLAIYKAVLNLVPHKQFTFAKLWTMLAHFHLRRLDVTSARKTMGMALGMSAKPKIYKDYIEMELNLREFDRCRHLYEKFIEFDPSNSETWIQFVELERLLMDDERARAIYEMSIKQEVDLPEKVWKSYIDFEIESGNYENARQLYEKLLQRTEHLKVWVSYANFEAELPDIEAMERARKVFLRGYDSLKYQSLVNERILLLEAWKEAELRIDDNPESPSVMAVIKRMPKLVTRRHKTEDGWETYDEYVFPEDEVEPPSKKLLEMAHKWKMSKNTE